MRWYKGLEQTAVGCSPDQAERDSLPPPVYTVCPIIVSGDIAKKQMKYTYDFAKIGDKVPMIEFLDDLLLENHGEVKNEYCREVL